MNATAASPRYAPAALVEFSAALFRAAGMDEDKAGVVAHYLVEADLMGHTTHGLQLCAPYLGALESGSMIGTGRPEVVSDRGAAVVWDGGYLPGVWLTATAVDEAVARAEQHGIASIAIRRSHHIGCLAVFLERATDEGFMVIVTCSDPAVASVAPYGGVEPVFTPDPIAVGIPTEADPILIDVSASITTNGMTGRQHAEGARMAGEWAIDAEGRASDDPAVLFTDPPGTLLPVGGLDHGHKGYALALLVEALSQGLSGHGRADRPTTWGASVYVQVMDPMAFGGGTGFTRQTAWIANACRTGRPRDAGSPVRLPGERALALREQARERGVSLHPGIMEALEMAAERLGVAAPRPA